MLPFLLVLLGLVILTEAPWLLFVGLGVLLFAKMHRNRSRYDHKGWHQTGWHGGSCR